MSIADMLGVEDNPFGLFLILILLLGATGYFDPQEKKVPAEVAPSGESKPSSKPSITLPIWQTRPKEPVLVRPFSGPRTETARPGDLPSRKKDLLPAILDILGLARRKKPAYGLAKTLRRRGSKHPLLRLRHKMQQ